MLFTLWFTVSGLIKELKKGWAGELGRAGKGNRRFLCGEAQVETECLSK